MKIFKSIFGKNNNNSQLSAVNDDVSEYSDKILEKIFVDENPPEAVKEENSKPESKILIFLNQDYKAMGWKDGYEHGTQELFDVVCKELKSEFLLMLDEVIEEKKMIISKMTVKLIEIGNISETTNSMLKQQLEEVRESINELKNQKMLSAEDEGWVMKIIHSYNDGFKRGLDNKIMEEDFLQNNSNL